MDERVDDDAELAALSAMMESVFTRLGEISLHLQMIDRNIEKLWLLALQINGQIPDRDE